MTIAQPANSEETRELLRWAIEDAAETVAIRLAIGCGVAGPAGHDHGVFRYPRAIIVFDLVVHIRVQRITSRTFAHYVARAFADRCAEAVGEVQHRDGFARRARLRPHQACAHQREGHPEKDRLRKDQQARDRDLRRERQPLRAERGQQARVRPVGQRDEDLVKPEREHADHRFDERVARKRIAQARRHAAQQRAAERHAAHEHDQHQRLRVRRVAQEKLEVVRPDRFVDQAGEARGGEQRVESRARWNLREHRAAL